MAESLGDLLVRIGADVGDLKVKAALVEGILEGIADEAKRAGVGFKSLEDASAASANQLGTITQVLSNIRGAFSQFQAGIITANQALQLIDRVLSPVVAGVRTFANFLGSAVQEAENAEQAVFRLNATLQSTGNTTTGYSDQLQQLAEKFSLLTTASDEAVLDVERLLVSFGAAPDQIAPATQAVLDLAAGLGTDLNSAAVLVGKAIAGEFGTLSRYGILVDETADKSTKLSQALSQIQTRFGGQATALLNTFAGQLEQATKAMDELRESIGLAITESPALQGLFRAVAQVATELKGGVDNARDALTSFVDEGVVATVDLLDEVGSAFIAAAKTAEAFARATIAAALAFVSPTDALNLFREGLTPLTDKLDALVPTIAKVQGAFNEAFAENLKRRAGLTAEGVSGIGSAISGAGASATAAKPIFESVFDAITSKANAAAEASKKVAPAANEVTQAIAAVPPTVEVGFDTEGQEKVLGNLKIVRDAAGKPIQVTADTGPASKELEKLNTDLEGLEKVRRGITIEGKVDRSEVDRFLAQIQTPQELAALQLAVDTAAAKKQLDDFTALPSDDPKRVQAELDLTLAQDKLTTFLETQDAKTVAVAAEISPAAEAAIATFLEKIPTDHTTRLLAGVDDGTDATIADFVARLPDSHSTALLVDLAQFNASLELIPDPAITRDAAVLADLTELNAAIAAIPNPIATRILEIKAVISGSPALPATEYIERYLPGLLDRLSETADLDLSTNITASIREAMGVLREGSAASAEEIQKAIAGLRDFKFGVVSGPSARADLLSGGSQLFGGALASEQTQALRRLVQIQDSLTASLNELAALAGRQLSATEATVDATVATAGAINGLSQSLAGSRYSSQLVQKEETAIRRRTGNRSFRFA